MINYNYNDDLTINYKFQRLNKGKFTFGCLKNRAKQNKTKLNKTEGRKGIEMKRERAREIEGEKLNIDCQFHR